MAIADIFISRDRLITLKAGVAALAGTSFGEFGEGYIRFSYANSMENIAEGLDRLQTYLS